MLVDENCSEGLIYKGTWGNLLTLGFLIGDVGHRSCGKSLSFTGPHESIIYILGGFYSFAARIEPRKGQTISLFQVLAIVSYPNAAQDCWISTDK